MKTAKRNSILKSLFIDLFMLFLFALLLGGAVWVVWMYFFRGPVDIETRGFVSRTLKETVIQPTDKEKYTLQHFHNLDTVVLGGIEYQSGCVSCHGDYPHNKAKKTRAFFNAHAWFIACEVCHVDNDKLQTIVTYRWLDNLTDNTISELEGEPGIYNARIVPLGLENGAVQRLDTLFTATFAYYDRAKDNLDEKEKKQELDKMHQGLNKKPVFCDQCHTEKGLLDFEELLYSDKMGSQLKSLDAGAMIEGYKVFYLPNVYGRDQASPD